jgi:hypothetical protein
MSRSPGEATVLDAPANRPRPAVQCDVAVPQVESGEGSGRTGLAAHADIATVLVWQLRLANRRPWDTSHAMVERLLAGLRADQDREGV